MTTNESVRACSLWLPTGPAIPLVCDSPHSGTDYPADFRPAIPMARLRRGEDTHVDALWSAVPEVGGTLLAADFPRTYIDANRTLSDLDPELLDGAWPEPLDPGPKTRLGYGLVWRNLDAQTPIYDRRLTVDEVRRRIARYYQPYHDALKQAILRSTMAFGCVWHLNLHSMPNDAYARLKVGDGTKQLADFVLGDRDGTTCEPAFVDLIETALRDRGYTVARNDPYKGVELIARIGQPALRRHSLQIEIRRPVYMDEATRERHAGFDQVRADLAGVLRTVADYIQQQVGGPGA